MNLKNIFLFETNLINSFYLLMYSSYSVISNSTFSYAAYLLSKSFNLDRVIIYCTIIDIVKKYKSVDIITSEEWNIIYNKSYILNFNKKIIIKMIIFNKKYYYNYYKKKIYI